MKAIKIYFCIFLFFGLSFVSSAGEPVGKIMTASERLEIAFDWILTEAFLKENAYLKEAMNLSDYFLRTFQGIILEASYFDGEVATPSFYLFGSGTYNQKEGESLSEKWVITRFQYRQTSQGFYEYWVIKKMSVKAAIGCEFIITRSDNEDAGREIVKREQQYYKEYLIGDTASIIFPENDNNVLYHLEAWLWPCNYLNTTIDDYRVLPVFGKLHKYKIGYLERLRYRNRYREKCSRI